MKSYEIWLQSIPNTRTIPSNVSIDLVDPDPAIGFLFFNSKRSRERRIEGTHHEYSENHNCSGTQRL